MYRNIQLLRAVAALMVFLHHIGLHYAAMNGSNPVLRAIMEVGYAGVDVFFVISGFIMMHLITDGPAYERDARTFIGRRFVRIYFWYWPCLLATFIAVVTTDRGRLPELSLLGSVLLASLRHEQLVLFVSWSLTHELYFYVLTTLLLFVPRARVPRIVAAAFVLQVAFTALTTYREGTVVTLLTSPYNLEFLSGCLLFFHRERLYRWGDELVLLALAALFFYLGAHYQVVDTVRRVPTFGLGAFFAVALALLVEKRGRFVAGDAMMALGEASYTIYLLHLVLIALFYNLGIRTGLAAASVTGRELGFLAFMAVSLLLCVGISRWIEMPFIRWSYRRLGLARAKHPDGEARPAGATMPT